MLLREVVTFQRQAAADDGYGNTTGAWADLFTKRGRLVSLRGGEKVEAGRLEASYSHVLKVRSDSETQTLTAGDQAVIDGAAYQIRSIDNTDRRDRYLTMDVERGVAS